MKSKNTNEAITVHTMLVADGHAEFFDFPLAIESMGFIATDPEKIKVSVADQYLKIK